MEGKRIKFKPAASVDSIINSLKKAKKYSFLLLKFRLRSENELRQRLSKKQFNAEVIRGTVQFLKKNGFLDDNDFAKVWIESRITRPLGIRRLQNELETKGISKEIIARQLNETKKNYREEEMVLACALSRQKKLKGVEPQKAKKRIFAYLMRRGFSPDIVIDVVNKL